MTFLAKARKEDLRTLATELGEEVEDQMKIIDLRKLITKSLEYEESSAKEMLETIVEARLAEEKIEERKRRDEIETRKMLIEAEEQKRQSEIRMEELKLEQKRLEVSANKSEKKEGKSNIPRMDIQKLVPSFDMKNDDISLFLALFERQAKIMQIPDEFWVAQLVSVLPSEIVALIAREPEEEAAKYEYIKKILLKRFKLGPENFRQKFVKHQKKPESTWRDFYYELQKYFEEWLEGLEIKTFEQVKDLMIADQIKRKAPADAREHFLDLWSTITSPTQLTEKLDEYEGLRQKYRKPQYMQNRDKVEKRNEYYERPRTPPTEKSRSWNNRYESKYPPRKYGVKIEQIDSKPKGDSPYNKPRITCFKCGLEGHIAKSCTTKLKSNNNSQVNVVSTKKPENKESNSEALTAKISISVAATASNVDALELLDLKCAGKQIKGILDTGAQISVIRHDNVTNNVNDSEGTINIISAFGECEEAPLRICMVKIDDDMHGEVPITCAVSRKLISDMLVCRTAYEMLKENVQLFNSQTEDNPPSDEEIEMNFEPVSINQLIDGKNASENVIPNEGSRSPEKDFMKLQREDESLSEAWKLAKDNERGYFIEDDFLLHKDEVCGEAVKQVVLPQCKRKRVLEIGHDIPLAGHLGEAKTRQRIKYSFFWPSLKKDVKEYCSSCKICQLRKVTTYRDRIPIQPVVRPDDPFDVWSVDCIGPLEPASSRGHKYIICAVDLCTRWAEAIPVRNITAKTTCDVLMKIFSQTGFPRTICTDQGTNFTSQLTKAFYDILGISPRFSTPGHPESMGAVERWNRTLKDMLNKNIQEHGRNWDLHLPFLLFAYREVPHSTTGLSPFQMVYGRIPSGPLTWIKDFWTGKREIPISPSRSVESYISDLQEKLKNAYTAASKNAEKSQQEYTSRYNTRSKGKSFNVGDKVLILHPSSPHKLLNTWQGPAEITQLTRPHSVLVKMEDGSSRELHVNKVRPYVARVQHIGLIFDQDEDFGEIHYAPTDPVEKYDKSYNMYVKERCAELNKYQQRDLLNLLNHCREIFSSSPGLAKVPGHKVKLKPEFLPRKLRPYNIPIALQNEVERQINELLRLGLIEPSESEWAHPIVCVSKKDGKIRLCVDYRHLNSFTVADAYPMQDAKKLLFEVGQANYISVLDLTKGYWQIPMSEEARHLTAFVTHNGHYQFRVMPFGMKNAGSTFQKTMDKALAKHRKYCRSYIDDVAIYSSSWEEHIDHLKRVFQSIKEIGFTVNLEKYHFAKKEVKFLGHIVGSGKHTPDSDKVKVLMNMSRPTNKKEVRSVLGLASYYREYIENFSNIVLPLTNLTKKRAPNIVKWGTEEETSYQKLKEILAKLPSLFTPVLTKPFQLYTDASATAVGACLSQTDENGKEQPIAFYSKKLSPSQTRWSTIEREAYSVIAALQKFDTWIFGAEIEVISDHNPLTYLTKTHPHGAKLARWALALQRYNLKISYRKGVKHGNADALSRLPFSE